jgi:magnesium transporter
MRTQQNRRQSGLPPGSLVFVGNKKVEKPKISLLAYNDKQIIENNKIVIDSEEFADIMRNPELKLWLNITGVHDEKLIEKIGDKFAVHPLILEDILNTEAYPKVDFFENYLFMEMKSIDFNEKAKEFEFEQVCFLLGKNYVISLTESTENMFEIVKERLKNNGKLTQNPSDYLCYSLLDKIIDDYFVALEQTGELIEELQDELLLKPSSQHLKEIHQLKKSMMNIRRSVWPLREIIRRLEVENSNLINDTTNIYFKDLYDHIIQIMETIETQRETVAGLIDIYLSGMSNRMNEIMKLLTIITTIFIPLSFIAGVYGMNFENMPELKTKSGYFIILGMMLMIALGMIYYFKRKKWL